MDKSALDVLAQRLSRLERQIRWWKLMGGSVAVSLGLILLLAAYPSKIEEEVRAKRFVVVDPSGNPVGEFSAKEGTPTLKLSDPRGGARVVLSHGYDTPTGLSISDGKRTRADLSLRLDDSMALDLFDKEGRLRAVIAVSGDGLPGLVFHDKSGKAVRKTP